MNRHFLFAGFIVLLLLGIWMDLPYLLGFIPAAGLVAYSVYGFNQPEIIQETNQVNPLSKMADSVSRATSKMARGAAEVSSCIDRLHKDIESSSQQSTQILAASTQLATSSTDLSQNLQTVAATISQTATACSTADARLGSGVSRVGQLAETINQVASQFSVLQTSADNIQRITEVIKSVAEQTNLLALNAAIEAARAGEQGRGFAVVADEVRMLAGKTASATKDIASMLMDIRQQSQSAGQQMQALKDNSDQVKVELESTVQGFKQVNAEVQNSSASLNKIEIVSEELESTSKSIKDSINHISKALETADKTTLTISQQATDVSLETESIFGDLATLSDRLFFSNILQEAINASSEIGKILERGIEQRIFSEIDLFTQDYKPIPKTQPQKYKTAYDDYTDKHFPDIQEPILARHSEIAFAGAVDTKGYFPTHNKKYAQPLTGNLAQDLINNRTKRIFNDRTGIRCGANTLPMLLQTYKRDTGEVMHDLSVPIYVKGRHWGGFRIGFKPSQN